jgi:hypothetical protein
MPSSPIFPPTIFFPVLPYIYTTFMLVHYSSVLKKNRQQVSLKRLYLSASLYDSLYDTTISNAAVFLLLPDLSKIMPVALVECMPSLVGGRAVPLTIRQHNQYPKETSRKISFN